MAVRQPDAMMDRFPRGKQPITLDVHRNDTALFCSDTLYTMFEKTTVKSRKMSSNIEVESDHVQPRYFLTWKKYA